MEWWRLRGQVGLLAAECGHGTSAWGSIRRFSCYGDEHCLVGYGNGYRNEGYNGNEDDGNGSGNGYGNEG